MRKGILSAVALCLLGASLAQAQTFSPFANTNAPVVAGPAIVTTGVQTLGPGAAAGLGEPSVCSCWDSCENGGSACPHRVWISADYLLWWIKSAPQPPLVTTGNTINQGVPGQLGTMLLYGGNQDFGPDSGLRMSAGFWLDPKGTIGVEAAGFFLARQSHTFSAASDANGSPLIARPALDATDGNLPFDYVDSFPSGPVFGDPTTIGPAELAGGVNVNYTVQFSGWEVNSLFNLTRNDSMQLDLIGGFRMLSLREDLKIMDSLTPLQNDGFVTFLGTPLNAGDHLADFDEFGTSNHFYGGQIGARLRTTLGAFTVEGTVKVGLGATREVLNISGATADTPLGGSTQVAPGGIYAQTTNIGQTSRSEFSVVPEVGLNVGWQATDRIFLRMGYSFLYWSDVLRPGDQINPSLNRFIVPSDQLFGTGTGPAQPAPFFKATGFWAMGLNFGAEFRF